MMKNVSQFNKTPYSYEFPILSSHHSIPRPACGVKCVGEDYATIEECIEACRASCAEYSVNYDDCKVKLFMTDTTGKWEVTEEGELAG